MIFSLHIEPSDCGWLCLSERQELSRFQSLEVKGTRGGFGPHRFLSGLAVLDVACRTAGGTRRAKNAANPLSFALAGIFAGGCFSKRFAGRLWAKACRRGIGKQKFAGFPAA